MTRIVTHNDFDGIVSGALCSYFLNIDSFYFTGPVSINKASFPISQNDIVCDLPYPLECGMWFDHHQGNLDELRLRGINPDDIDGSFAPLKSCARVILNYFEKLFDPIPQHLKYAAAQADIIDSFDYKSIDEWRKETPAKIIEGSLKTDSSGARDSNQFMNTVIRNIREIGIEGTAQQKDVLDRWHRYCDREEGMIKQISQDSYFLNQDINKELVIIDMTKHNRRPDIIKNLAYIIFPEAKGVVEIKNSFSRGVKSNNISVAMSLSINMDNEKNNYDVGHIMRSLNIGDGHKGAGAGRIDCSSKQQMIREKEKVLENIYKIWREENGGRV